MLRQTDQLKSAVNRRTFLKISGGAALGATAFLAGCSGSSGSSGSMTALTHYNWQFGEQGTHAALLRYFDEYHKTNPQVQVSLQWIPSDYGTKLSTSLLSASPPDTWINGSPDPNQTHEGQFAVLDDILAGVKSDYSDTVLKQVTLGSHLYAIPMFVDPQFIFYRKSLLAKAGVQPPKTMAELAEVAKATTTGNVKGLFVGNDNASTATKRGIVWASGTDYIINNKVAFNTPKVVQGVTTLRSMMQAGTVLQGAPTDWYDPTVFTEDLVAMHFIGMWAMPTILAKFGDDVGIVPWPGADANTSGSVISNAVSVYVNGKGKHLDQAKAFAKSLWIDNTKDQLDWDDGYGFHVPTRNSVTSSAAKLKTGLAAEGVQLLQQYGHGFPPLWSTSMDTVFGDAISNIFAKGADPASTLAVAQEQCQTLLDKIPTFS